MRRMTLFGVVIVILSILNVHCESPALSKAKSYLKRGQKAEAKEQLLLAVEADPEDYIAHFLLGEMYLEEEDYLQMNEHFNLSLKYGEGSRDLNADARTQIIKNGKDFAYVTLYNEGIKYYNQGRDESDEEKKKLAFESTIKSMNDVYSIKEDNQALFMIAVANMALGDDEEAERYFKTILEDDPKDIDALINLGNMKFRQAGEKEEKNTELYNEPLQYYLQVVKYSPEELPTIITQLAWCFDILEKYGEAVKYYKMSIEIDPDNNHLISALGVALFNNGDVDEAIEQFKKALENDPDNLELVKNIAYPLWNKAVDQMNENVQLTQDDLETVVMYMEKVAELDENNVTAWESLAIMYARLDKLGVEGATEKMNNAFAKYEELTKEKG